MDSQKWVGLICSIIAVGAIAYVLVKNSLFPKWFYRAMNRLLPADHCRSVWSHHWIHMPATFGNKLMRKKCTFCGDELHHELHKGRLRWMHKANPKDNPIYASLETTLPAHQLLDELTKLSEFKENSKRRCPNCGKSCPRMIKNIMDVFACSSCMKVYDSQRDYQTGEFLERKYTDCVLCKKSGTDAIAVEYGLFAMPATSKVDCVYKCTRCETMSFEIGGVISIMPDFATAEEAHHQTPEYLPAGSMSSPVAEIVQKKLDPTRAQREPHF